MVLDSPLFYLAAPYKHKDPAVIAARVEAVNKFVAPMIEAGNMIYSPVSYSVGIDKYIEYSQPDLWYKHGLTMLSCCDKLWVLMLDGWKDSFGVTLEITYAKNQGMEINYFNEEGAMVNHEG